MAITDLTNTTWYVPSGWSATAGYGSYKVDGAYIIGSSTSPTSSDEFYIGYFEYTDETVPIAKSNSCSLGYPDGWRANISPSEEFTVSITGGDDADEPSLIQWLYDNNAVQLKVTDLTNTTWTVNAGWEAEAGYGLFNVDGVCDSVYSFNALHIGSEFDGDDIWSDKAGSLCYENYDESADTAPEWYQNFNSSQSLSLSFTGGTDTTDPKLIAWLSKWGELQVEEETPSITDLTGYTVTVPDGWSAPSGYGKFAIEGILEPVGQIYESYRLVVDTNHPYPFNVGYMARGATANYILSSGIASDDEFHSFSFTTYGFTFNITGGNDVTNSSLIQWLVDNNATFEKTGGEEEPDTPEIPDIPHGEIYYDGNLVATLVEGETIVLHAKDFKFLGDIVIKNVGEVEEETPAKATVTITVTEDSGTYYYPIDEDYNVYSAVGDGSIDNDNWLIVAPGETKTLVVPVGSIVGVPWEDLADHFENGADGEVVFSGDCSTYGGSFDTYIINGDTNITATFWEND